MSSITFSKVSKIYAAGTNALTDMDLHISDGEFLVLIGPSGCGKSTALRMVAGLEEISSGEISINEIVVNDLDPRRRDVAMVFQNYALYPHMSVFDNMAFPLRSMRMPKSEIQARVLSTAQRLGLDSMLNRRPKTLSGGQRQRVAMGRAIVREPKAFLMDEPLSNLDAKLRTQMRAEISALQQELGTTTIYVTHDQVEALTMGTRIAVMRRGLLQQDGPPQEIYERPANLFVASFLGSPAMNLIKVRLVDTGPGLRCEFRDQYIELPGSVIHKHSHLGEYIGREVALGLRPEHISDTAVEGCGAISATVCLIETLGSERLIHLKLPADPVLTEDVLDVARDTDDAALQALQAQSKTGLATIVAKVPVAGSISIGDNVRFGVDARKIQFFSLESGESLH